MWDPVFILAEALEKANSLDPDKVAEAMRDLRHEGLFGVMTYGMESVYGIKCTLTREVPMGIIKDGEPTYLATVEWPTEEVIAKLNKPID